MGDLATMAGESRRNLNPTAPALVAMNLWGARYAQRGGGSMDFWDSLNAAEKAQCFHLAELIRQAPMPDSADQ